MADQEEVACVDETKTFTSLLDCVFVADADELTEAELLMTVRGVKTVYNDLQSESVCDQLFRIITNVSVPEQVPDEETVADKSKGEVELRYQVTGSCRGCPEPVFFEDSINRDPRPGRALIGEESLSSSLPFLVDERDLEIVHFTSCTCPAGAEQRGLQQSDFVEGYNEWIALKKEEGIITNLNELLSLKEEGTFKADAPESGAYHNFSGVLLLYSLAVTIVLRRLL